MLVAFRVTSQTQFDGIKLERDRELVHRGFERIHARRRARRAHVARGRQIQVSEPVRVRRVCGPVEQAGPARLLPIKVFVLRGHSDRIVRDRLQRSAGRSAELDALNHRGSITQCVHLRPSQRHADGALQRPCRQHGEHPLELRTQP